MKDIHDAHHMLKGCCGHIFPTLIEKTYAMLEEAFGIITKTNKRVYAITTVRMFSWLL